MRTLFCISLGLLFNVNGDYLKYLRQVMDSSDGGNGTTTTSATTSQTTTQGCTQPIWTDWASFMSCDKDCGACGTQILRRSCNTSAQGCYCPGESQRTVPCNIGACGYPYPACCPPSTLMFFQNTFACGPQTQEILQVYTNSLALANSTNGYSPPPSYVQTPVVNRGTATPGPPQSNPVTTSNALIG
ncbi:unnamed protein product, partial [Mesorhabditis belari]|uniref:Uncharacterized protein n=1 Tax=Mesorhabditis belari TaxID=2138241 RepID=A0AAF3ETD9_9BILA